MDQDTHEEAHHKDRRSPMDEGKCVDTEKKFQNLVEHINDWVWEVDENCFYTYASPSVYRMLGYTPGEVLGKTPFDLMSPDESIRVQELFYSIFQRQDDFSFLENTLITKDGGNVIVETSGTPIYDDHGIFIGYRGIDRDITEHKHAEDALQKSEERFRHLVEFSPIPMTINDSDDRITYMNEKFIKTFGYTHDDIPDLEHWWRLAYPDPAYRREVKDRWTKSVETAVAKAKYIGPLEEVVTCKDGSIRHIEFTGTTIEDKKLVIMQDITEKKEAERTMKLIQFSIEKAAEMLIWVAPDGRITKVNEATCKSFGYTREEMLSLRTFDTNPYFNESNWGEHWKEIKDRGSFTFEASLRKKDGSMFPAEITVNYLVYEGNEYNCSFVRDITERKRVYRELEMARDQAELYVDLMGHDINNLNQIGMGFLELALDTLNLDENGRLIIAKSLGALEGSSRLIDNVRKLQKIRSGELQGQVMDVGQILADVQKNYSQTCGKDIAIHYTPASGYLVMANELLYDIFSNLVNNAIKHAQAVPVIDISLRKVHKGGGIFYQVAVEDNGPGIPDELKVKVFNRHLRGNTKAKGSGIGLYLVKTLADSYGGSAWVEDRVSGDRSKGSRFVIMLPALEK